MADNQQGNAGLSFPNSLGVQFSRSQVSGGGAAPPPAISTVTLTQSGDLIFATPGTSFVNIGETTTGSNVEFISQMAGTTFLNSPVMINGNVVLPHPYNFSVNPENNPATPTVTMNANLTIGGSGSIIDIGTGTEIESVQIQASNVSIVGSPVTLTGNSAASITIDGASQSTIDIQSPQTINLFAPYVATSASTIQTFSSNAMEYVASNLVSYNTNNFSTLTSNTFMYSSNLYSNYNGGYSVYADGGTDPGRTPTISLVSENGVRGDINVQAKGGLFGFGLPGTLTMEAYGATNPAVGLGGLVSIQSYSGNFGEYGGLTSRVAIGAANVGISAGAAPTFPGIAGSMNLYGQGLVSLVAAVVPPVLLQIPETAYIYGQGGVRLQTGTLGVDTGIQLLSDTYAGTIYPLANGSNPLIIRGRTSPTAGVQLLDVERINMVSPNGFITAVSSINNLNLTSNRDISNLSTINGQPYPYITPSDTSNWATYNQVSSLSSITAVVGVLSTLNVSSINGLPLGTIWYDVPAQANVNMNGFTFTNLSTLTAPIVSLSTINGTRYIPTQNWSLTSAVSAVDFAGQNAGNVAELFVNDVAIGNALYFINPNGIIDINDNALLGVSSIEALAGNQISFANAGLINISSINGQPIASPVAAFVSTATSDLNMRAFDIVSTLNLVALNEVAAPTLSGQVGILTTTLQVPQIEFLSTINGVPYVPFSGTSTWVSNAASALNMNLFNINSTQTLTTNNITCIGTVTTAAVSASGNISATGTMTATAGLNAPGGVNALPGAVSAATGGFTTVNTNNMNTSNINGQLANDYLPQFTFGPFATTGTIQLTYPGQYFFSGITPGVVIDMYINADTTGVPTPSGASGTGNYVLTNKNSFNTSINIYLQILGGSVAAYIGFQIGPNVSCTFALARSALGNIVYQNLGTSVPFYPPSGY